MIVVPYYASASSNLISGVHVVTAFMKYLNTVKWLAKDVILVCVPDHRRELIPKWVAAYHSDMVSHNNNQSLPMNRSGTIRTALVLDLPPSSSFEALTIVSGTSQGVLANFDMVAIIQYMMQQHNIPLTISDLYDNILLRSSEQTWGILNRWRPMLRFWADSVSGLHAGLHGIFIEYNIDALSLIATGVSHDTQSRTALYVSLTQVFEEIVRSFSNLIEKLHHSSFLYILISSTRLITFVVYYWSAMILSLPWALAVLQRMLNDLTLSTMMPAFHQFLILISWALSLRYLPVFFQSGFYSNFLIWILSSMISLGVSYSLSESVSWIWLHSLVSCMSFIVIVPYCMSNFIITLVFAFATVPLILVRPSRSKLEYFRNVIVLILCSPITSLLITSMVFDITPIDLIHNFVTNISTSNHPVYPLMFLLYLPNYAVAIIGACSKCAHVKTD